MTPAPTLTGDAGESDEAECDCNLADAPEPDAGESDEAECDCNLADAPEPDADEPDEAGCDCNSPDASEPDAGESEKREDDETKSRPGPNIPRNPHNPRRPEPVVGGGAVESDAFEETFGSPDEPITWEDDGGCP